MDKFSPSDVKSVKIANGSKDYIDIEHLTSISGEDHGLVKKRCPNCGSTDLDKVFDGYVCNYCQNPITKDEVKIELEEEEREILRRLKKAYIQGSITDKEFEKKKEKLFEL